jgi:hypothetical protein
VEARRVGRLQLPGVDYTIDLTAKEAAGFDKAIAMYVEHATEAGRARSRRQSPASTQHHAERIGNMKRWAAEQGIDYPKRGGSEEPGRGTTPPMTPITRTGATHTVVLGR